MRTSFVTLTEDCLVQMVLSGLEAYVVRHATPKTRGENRLETYGLLWGGRTELPGGNPVYTLQMMSIDTSAKRSNGEVEPSNSAIALKRDIMTDYWPTRKLLGDFHTHPYDPSEASLAAIQKQRLFDFSEQDRTRLEGADNPWIEWGYRVGIVLTITHLKGDSTILPGRVDNSVVQFALGPYRLWLKANLAHKTSKGIVVYPDSAEAVYLDCPSLLGLDGRFHDGLRHSKYTE